VVISMSVFVFLENYLHPLYSYERVTVIKVFVSLSGNPFLSVFVFKAPLLSRQ